MALARRVRPGARGPGRPEELTGPALRTDRCGARPGSPSPNALPTPIWNGTRQLAGVDPGKRKRNAAARRPSMSSALAIFQRTMAARRSSLRPACRSSVRLTPRPALFSGSDEVLRRQRRVSGWYIRRVAACRCQAGGRPSTSAPQQLGLGDEDHGDPLCKASSTTDRQREVDAGAQDQLAVAFPHERALAALGRAPLADTQSAGQHAGQQQAANPGGRFRSRRKKPSSSQVDCPHARRQPPRDGQ